jgi:hypothetical protein
MSGLYDFGVREGTPATKYVLARLGSDTIKMGLGGIGLEGRSWTELAKDRVPCWALVLAVLNLLVLLPERHNYF